MARPLGETFAPTSAADDETKKLNPAQQAIQVLSMRMPRVRGAKAISPLVGEPRSVARREVGGFSPHSAILETLMRSVGSSESAPAGSLPGMAAQGASNQIGMALPGLMGGASLSAPEVPSNKPAPVIIPGFEQPTPPSIVPMLPDPVSSGAGPREPREPFMPAPRIPDQGETREPRDPRPAPSPAPPLSVPPPPQDREPWTPRDPNAPIDITPVPGDVNTPDVGSASPSPSMPPIDPRAIAAMVDALFRRGGRAF